MSGRQSPQAGEQKPLPPIVVKKYANRRLYNTETSSYVTLDDLAAMVRDGRDFVVYDAKSGEDLTRSVLTQIIVEQEGKGQNMLPTSVLRQLIGLYGDNLQSLVPRYLVDHPLQPFPISRRTLQTQPLFIRITISSSIITKAHSTSALSPPWRLLQVLPRAQRRHMLGARQLRLQCQRQHRQLNQLKRLSRLNRARSLL